MTSFEVMMNFTTLPTGTTMPLVDRQQRRAVGVGAEALAGRDVGLFLEHVRDDLEPAIVGILVGPVPLVAGHLDRQVGLGRRILMAQQADRRDRDRDQDQHRDQRPDDLEHGVVGGPRRHRVGAAAVADHRVGQQRRARTG